MRKGFPEVYYKKKKKYGDFEDFGDFENFGDFKSVNPPFPKSPNPQIPSP